MKREYPKHPIPAVGVVVFKDENILLIQRNKPPKAEEWSIPGGAQNLGERMVNAAIREVKEETNIDISKNMLKHISDSGTLGLALGVMGAFLGLIAGFDALEASGQGDQATIAGGLKIALLSPLFGIFTYSISRLAILVLRIIQK